MGSTVAIVQLIWAPLLASGISGLYFVGSSNPNLRERLTISAHGVLLALIFLVALAVAFSGAARPSFAVPFWTIFVLPALSSVLALLRFRGNRAMHLLQVPLLAAAAWICFVGTMAVRGEWL